VTHQEWLAQAKFGDYRLPVGHRLSYRKASKGRATMTGQVLRDHAE
jgi:hypothetical protein